uniref:U24-Theriditoxin-Lha1a_1 n=1 Tax=Latrodectus hasselti TaxID=256736 RepID=A0A482ZAE2_LATHA
MKFIINIFAFITVFMEVHSMHISHSDSILHSSESTLKHRDADRVVKRDEPGVCQTDACKKTAEHILQSMDNKVNPCDDLLPSSRVAAGLKGIQSRTTNPPHLSSKVWKMT